VACSAPARGGRRPRLEGVSDDDDRFFFSSVDADAGQEGVEGGLERGRLGRLEKREEVADVDGVGGLGPRRQAVCSSGAKGSAWNLMNGAPAAAAEEELARSATTLRGVDTSVTAAVGSAAWRRAARERNAAKWPCAGNGTRMTCMRTSLGMVGDHLPGDWRAMQTTFHVLVCF